MSSAEFIHLHLHSAYSLAEGAIKVKDLIKRCKMMNMPAVAVTDTGNLFGAMEFSLEAAKEGVQPILGTQIKIGEEKDEIVFLVQTEKGYRNLCKIISKSYMETDDAESPHMDWADLELYSEGLICLTGGRNGVIYRAVSENQKVEAEKRLKFLKKCFGDRIYIEIQRHGWVEEEENEADVIDMAYEFDVPLVATNDCYFPSRSMYRAHDALLCIADGRYISEEDRRKVTPEHYFKSAEEMKELFADLPEAIKNTVQIAKRCSFVLKEVAPVLPPFDTEGGRGEAEELRYQAKEGLRWRIDNFVLTGDETEEKKQEIDKKYFDRLEFELEIIENMGFPGYFLIVSDFIKWAKENDIPVGPGRGSGAGSVVAWSLKITDLDPLEFNLLFERFLNPERVSMPDFDVDFCQARREEVIKYTQDKYGYDRVAQIITFGKLQARAVVRDVGRVLQMPYGQVDKIAKMIPSNPANPITLEEALDQDPDLRNEIKREETTENLINIALQLEGLYRHASTHAAGVVIGDRPLDEIIPLYRDPRSDMPVTQYNMKYVEQASLVKFDFLGLKTMTVVQEAVKLIKQVHDVDIDILSVPLNDENTYKMMSEGKTTGVFQLESAGMKDVLRKMRPNRFEDIIALVSLYRPGPMDNIPKYIDCKDGKEKPDYMHPVLKPILEETFGIMIYQEQVMQAAQLLSGYSLGGADLLRRAMGKKIKSEMDKQRKMFVEGAKKHNQVDEKQAEDIFEQINKFAGYGFNKSHAAAYALIAYWTAWLKANYPVEFMTATMTWDLGNTDKLAIFKQEVDKMGIKLLPPDVNRSLPVFKVEGKNIRYALAALKGVGEHAMVSLVNERDNSGEFKSLDNFVSRIDPKSLNRKQMEMLAASGAFECLEPIRAKVHSAADMLLKYANSLNDEKNSGQVSLFGADDASVGLGMPELPDVREWGHLEKLKMEFDAVGFYLSAHPLDNKRAQLSRLNIKFLSDIEEILKDRSSTRVQMAAVLLKKQEKVSPKSGNKYAFLQLSDPSGVFEGMMFSDGLFRCRNILEAGKSLLLSVDAEQKEEQIRFTIHDAINLDESLENQINVVEIEVGSEEGIENLKNVLMNCNNGDNKVKIHLCCRVDNYYTKIELAKKYALNMDSRKEITSQKGIIKVREN